MDKGQIIDDLLFPSDQQTPCAVRPGMTAFHDPTPSALPGATLGMHFAFTGDVRNIAEASCESLRGTTAVTLVQTEMLFASSGRPGARNGDRLQRGSQEFRIVSIGASDRDANWHATRVRDNGTFDAELTAIGGVFPGFFPRRAVPWSWPRPTLATAIRSRVWRHTFAGIASRSDERCVVGSIPESTDARCWTSRTAAATLSTGSRCATGRRFHQRHRADLPEDDRPSDYVDTWATAAPTAATFSPASAQTDHSNRNAFLPPCEEKKHPCLLFPTHEVTFCSVLG